MINSRKAEELIDEALDYARKKVQGTEVTIAGRQISTSRFANNSMTQNQMQDRSEISVRVIKDGRQARLSSDRLSSQSIRALVDEAAATLSFIKKDPDLLPLPGKNSQSSSSPKRFDKATAELSAEKRAKVVCKIIKVAQAAGLQAAGVVASGQSLLAIGNSRGLFVCHKETETECGITMNKNGSTGWAKAQEIAFDKLDCIVLAERAARKALDNHDPVEIPPGKYRVILEPAAVLDLLCYLAPDFTATSHLDKISCFLDRLDTKVFGENISIKDDCRHALQAGAPFDGEGVTRRSVSLVEKGVLKNLVYGRRSAEKMGKKASGHGLSEPSVAGESAVNLVIDGGTTSLADMISGEQRAILLTRVHYIREVDPMLKIVTGMTRDGCFLVENGKITQAVKNLRFNQSLIELLNNVIALGPAERVIGGEEFPAAVMPSMLVDRFNFASTTTF